MLRTVRGMREEEGLRRERDVNVGAGMERSIKERMTDVGKMKLVWRAGKRRKGMC